MAFLSRKRISPQAVRGLNEQRLYDSGLLKPPSAIERFEVWLSRQPWYIDMAVWIAAGTILGLAIVGATTLLRAVP
jgi:hypothetical protein